MNNKPGPYILLITLIIILTFIFGIRYGQNIEKNNKKVDYLLSQSLTKPAPSGAPLGFKTYSHTGCGISFLYPDFFKVEREGSYSARLASGKQFIIFDCQKNATAEPTITQNYINYEKTNPTTGTKIILTFEKSLLPLLEKSLDFVR